MAAKKIAKSKQRVKVTITLDPAIVKALRAITKHNGMSVSRLVEENLQAVTSRAGRDPL